VIAAAVVCALTVGEASAAITVPQSSFAPGSLYATVTRSRASDRAQSPDAMRRTPAIVTESGPLTGIMHGTVAEFLGIPYAAPPVGDLRWMPPRPFGTWSGVFDASSFGSQCTQSDGSGSEDCLFLNIYVPNFKSHAIKRRGALPVMLWIHGGGLTGGAGSDYDPTPLLKRGKVIVVTINYRLGYLGFFAQSALDGEGHESGNYGLMDQQFAMQWVKDNIAAFGGDPGNVTIFGESAGGHSVYCNLASPTAAGLFAHAIAESGSYLIFDPFIDPIVPLSTAESSGNGLVPAGNSVASSLGCSTAACLRAVSNTQLAGLEPGVLYAFVDGTLLTETPAQAFSDGNFNRVPVIAGTNHDEWRLFVAQQYDLSGNPILTSAEYDSAVTALWGSQLSPSVESHYPYAAFPSGGVALGASGTDGIFACSARNADQLLSKFTTTYAYEFNDENAPPAQSQVPGLTFPLGAYHGAELQYLFHILFFSALTPAQRRLSRAMVAYWTNFAQTGDPNRRSLPAWSPYDPAADVFQSLIAPKPTAESTFNSDHLCDGFWNTIP
jgi:para-nitrobenzyl esterase